jgi:glycosyltransferase involved in cell wall biosynthesis
VPRLSAIVITRNEGGNIAACLDTLAFCDERIVVDSGSEDHTAEIARAKGARVESHSWRGFGAQKSFALSLATGEWVLSIDADERVSPALARAIADAIAAGDADGYAMPRRSSFLGRAMRHSGWWPDYVLRLFHRGSARFTDHLVHERVVCQGRVARLREPLLHYPVLTLEDAIGRVDRYSTAGAEMLIGSSRRISFATGILHGFWSFLRAYAWRLGFLDGREGFLLAVANAEGTYYRYMKAWLKGGRAQFNLDLAARIGRMDRDSTAGAGTLVAAGRRVSFASGIALGLCSFVRAYGWRRGFLDGREGFLLATVEAEETYYRHMKAWLKTRR